MKVYYEVKTFNESIKVPKQKYVEKMLFLICQFQGWGGRIPLIIPPFQKVGAHIDPSPPESLAWGGGPSPTNSECIAA